jgi:hypothetical protein
LIPAQDQSRNQDTSTWMIQRNEHAYLHGFQKPTVGEWQPWE